MTRRDWYLNLIIIVGIWLVDFITKWAAVSYIQNVNFWGPFGLVLHYNPGAMLGAFANLPPVLRVVSLSTGGAFLCFIYLALQHMIPIKAKTLRVGMSILLGGILGNVTDRILKGSVTDFLLLGSMTHSSPAFNVADAVQWVGYTLIVYSLVKYGNLFWPEKNSRRSLWINPNFQVKYIVFLFMTGFGFSLICGVFFYTYLKVTIDALAINSLQEVENKFLTPFLLTFIVIALGFVIILMVMGRTLSHRIAGPLYAFEKFLEDLLSGNERPLKLRMGDDFQHLEKLSVRLLDRFKEKKPQSISRDKLP